MHLLQIIKSAEEFKHTAVIHIECSTVIF